MTRVLSLGALSVSLLALSAGQAMADYTLNILHINDWHSRIESNNRFESTCSAEEEGKGECFGGAARLVTAIADRRKALEGENLLVLNAGDNFQGSLFYTTLKGAAETEFMNRIGFDAMALGNHEFDDGESALVPLLNDSRAPVLGANVEAKAPFPGPERIRPSVVIERGGQRIGIVGVVTTDTPNIASPGPNVAFSDDVAAIQEEVARLEAEGVNKIVALTHVGYPRDRDVLAKIPGVDVVVGGHSHSVLSNTDDKAEGPYPTMVDNPAGYQVPVVQAGSYSKYLGELRVVFDDAGRVKEASGAPILLDATVKPDEAALARIRELGAPIEELKGRVVAEAAAPIEGGRETCRAQECAMGNLIADAMLDHTKRQGVTIAVQNGGGIRASIDAGPVTMGEVLTVLPFQNTLATFQLAGRDLVASLEQGVSAVEEGKGKFPQVAGLRFALDLSKPPMGGRVSNVEVMENGGFAPIDENKLYTIATNNFVREGGDDYELFETKAQNAYDFGPGLEEVVADYLAANAPYQPKVEGRITLAQAAPPAAPAPEPAAPAAPEPAAPAPAAEVPLPELPAASSAIANEPPPVADAPAPAATEAAPAAQTAQGAPEPANPAAQDPLPPTPAEPAVAEEPDAPAASAAPAAENVPLPELPAGSNSIAGTPPPAAEAPAAPAGQASPEPAEPAAEGAQSSTPAEPEVVEQPAAAAPAQPAAEPPAAAAPAPAESASPPAAAAPDTSAQTPVATPDPTAPTTHAVVSGDNLWDLAERFYGDGARSREIAAANPELADPDALEIGMILRIPPR